MGLDFRPIISLLGMMACRLTETPEPARLMALDGKIIPGHQAASGSGPGCPYPEGTIRAQLPFFLALGLDLSDCRPGTLNVDVGPRPFRLKSADWTFRGFAWTDRVPPENFSFSRCVIEVGDRRHPA